MHQAIFTLHRLTQRSVTFAPNHSYTLLIISYSLQQLQICSHISLCISFTGGPVCPASQNASVLKINPHFSPPLLDTSAPDLVVRRAFQGKWPIAGTQPIYWDKLHIWIIDYNSVPFKNFYFFYKIKLQLLIFIHIAAFLKLAWYVFLWWERLVTDIRVYFSFWSFLSCLYLSWTWKEWGKAKKEKPYRTNSYPDKHQKAKLTHRHI